MDIKVLTEQDFMQTMKLSMYAFQYQVAEADISKRLESFNKQKVFGIFDEGKLSSKLHLLSLKIALGHTEWSMGGIAGVATYPEYRRKGFVTALIRHALKEMNNRGDIVSFLHPFNINFYRRYGWEIVADYKKVMVEKIDLTKVGVTEGKIERFTKDSHSSVIEKVYQHYSKRYSSMLVRDASWWKDNVYGEQTIAVYFNSRNEATGYLLYDVKNDVMKVDEYVSLDHEARLGLWNYICQHDSMVERVELQLSIHEPFPYFLEEPKVKTEIHPYFMARIVNAEKAFKNYPFIDTGEKLFLHLEDKKAPWNGGSYLIGQKEVAFFPPKEGSSCVKAPERGVCLNINTLTAMLFGHKRPIELYEMDLLKGDLAEIQKLERIIPPFKSLFYDFF